MNLHVCSDAAVLTVLKGLIQLLAPKGKRATVKEALDSVVSFSAGINYRIAFILFLI